MRGGSWSQVQWTALEPITDAAHTDIAESAVVAASVDRLDLTGATLIDVEIRNMRATTLSARSARLRRVRILAGRIGTLDLADAEIDELELRDVRIDYLSLAGARVHDLVVAGCELGTLDMPQAKVSRAAFADTRADEVDTRAMRARDLDLRGLDAVSYLDLTSLRGATFSARQVAYLAPALAEALGIRVLD